MASTFSRNGHGRPPRPAPMSALTATEAFVCRNDAGPYGRRLRGERGTS
jgi:hypothetical protein